MVSLRKGRSVLGTSSVLVCRWPLGSRATVVIEIKTRLPSFNRPRARAKAALGMTSGCQARQGPCMEEHGATHGQSQG